MLCRVGIRISTVGSHYHLQTELMGKSVQKNISKKRKTSLQCTKRSRGKGVSLNTDRLQFLDAWLGFIFLTLDIHKIVQYLFKINLFYLKQFEWVSDFCNQQVLTKTSSDYLDLVIISLVGFLNNLKRLLTKLLEINTLYSN